mgnify:CR=1 FL=1
MYYFVLSNNFIGQKQDTHKITLKNLKSYLLTFEFEDEIKIKWLNSDNFECYVFMYKEIIKDLVVTNLFKEEPEVYDYTVEQNRIEFNDLKLNTFEEFNVIFEYGIDSDMKSDDLVVDIDEKIYVFNSIYNNPIEYKYLHEVLDDFENRITEVRDAF